MRDIVDTARKRSRMAQESLYDATCSIFGQIDYTKPNGATAQKEGCYITDHACKVGKKTLIASNQTDAENTIVYTPQLFISPELDIRPGSKVIVTQIKAGKTIMTKYEQTGVPAVYDTHQEIIMKLTEKKA